MRRLATALIVVLAGVAVVFALGASNGPSSPSYWVELDNAFGLVQGGDMKVAGVRAGTIKDLKLGRKMPGGQIPALVKISIKQNGFGSLRTDVTCQSRPQSLIGEYFLDCSPGTSPKFLQPGSTIPLSHTSSTIGPDLVNDVLRDPYRQRLAIFLDELGAGVAGNAHNLNAAIRRAVPALTETDKVLGILAQQNRILARLASEGDAVVTSLADNRKDVQRWAVNARNISRDSATRQAQIAAGIRQLPGFLEQLRPAMQALGQVADQQTPAFRNLNASAGQLKTFFDRLTAFSQVSTPAFQAFGNAAAVGNQAVLSAGPTVDQLNAFVNAGGGTGVPELSKNLSIITQHLDNRAYAVEANTNSPGGKGYTGLEALLNYFFNQSNAVNSFDSNEHILNVSAFLSDCANYEDAQAVKDALAGKNNLKHCISWVGPTQPGVTTPDPTAPGAPKAHKPAAKTVAGVAPVAAPVTPTTAPLPSAPVQLPPLQSLLNGVTGTVNKVVGAIPKVKLPSILGHALPGGQTTTTPRSQKNLLDYLLAP